jgi:alkaline phosphatase D
MTSRPDPSRRKFLEAAGAALGAAALPAAAPRITKLEHEFFAFDGEPPKLAQGLQIGDVEAKRAVIWSRADRPSRMFVEYASDPSFSKPVLVRGPHALEVSDYTARVDLTGLRPDSDVYLRVFFQDLSNERLRSDPVAGRFRTAPRGARDIRFLWSGDTAGQGWGINPEFGGMRIYETMRATRPDFFIHCGDTIYADGPIREEQPRPEGGPVWKNVVTPEVSKVAETLDEFRGRYKYNLLDENVRRFNAEVPQIWQWDDHEVVNNWSDAKDLSGDARYAEKNVPLLVARGGQAFREYAPIRLFDVEETERIYRHIRYGDLLDVFVIDMRSYRGPNSFNQQTEPGPETDFLGRNQLEWLRDSLRDSKAIWKVIASDMPLGLVVPDGPLFENVANGDGPALGREFELRDFLRYLKSRRIQDVVWLTADVHYTAAHFYDPRKAVFRDFDPFWEFVSGPLNAGTFGPNALDNTFGPQVVYQKATPVPNYSPLAGLQFFGQVDIDERSARMTVRLKDIEGATLFEQKLMPSRRRHDD